MKKIAMQSLTFFSLNYRVLAPSSKKQQQRSIRRQTGAISIMFALLFIPIVGICALALDLAMVYNRQAEMHSFAKAVAISAARRLNGTPSGIDNAVSDAALSAGAALYKNHNESIAWTAAALKFGTSANPNGQWVDAGTASSMAAKIFFARVDTSAISGAGAVQTAIAAILSADFATVTTGSDVIAGKTDIAVAPLGVCAMGAPASARTNPGGYVELVEYGFRRGVNYDLMNLNPNASSAVSFVINPLAAPGTSGAASGFATATVGPYACTGTLAIPGVTGGKLSVAQPFPLGALYSQLNSRFDQYTGASCTVNAAPPDANIKAFNYTDMVSPLAWMNTQPVGQTASAAPSASRLETIADIAPAGGTAVQYGPLWSYARAVAYSTYTASPVEPLNGYATLPTSAWTNLYGGQTAKSSYPASTPYKAGTGINFSKPNAAHGNGTRNRRVLNVALLDCSTTPSSTADVLAIGKFFMTVPATSTVLAAEFAGIIPLDRIPGNTGLFQ